MTVVDPDSTQTSRRRLLEAGKALFARFGFEQTSTAIIAREAGTSESQLVRYYKGKAGLLEAIFNDCWAALHQHIQGVVVAATDAREALEIWPVHVIEEALGEDADSILPRAIRCAELRVRLPRHHIDMLEYRAEQRETTVSGVLARELDGIASAHAEELSAALPGFAEAMAWPDGFL